MAPSLNLQDAGTAKSLAFNKDVRTRCVTLDGDDFNPGGTLTGCYPQRCTSQHLTKLLRSCIATEAHPAGFIFPWSLSGPA